MTEDEKEKARVCKAECVKRLREADLKAYRLEQIDRRLSQYARGLIGHPERHNMYELLALERFLKMLELYTFRIDKAQEFIAFYEQLRFSGGERETELQDDAYPGVSVCEYHGLLHG